MNTAYIYQGAWELISDRRPETEAIQLHPPLLKTKERKIRKTTTVGVEMKAKAKTHVHTVRYKFSLSGVLVLLLDLRGGCTGEALVRLP